MISEYKHGMVAGVTVDSFARTLSERTNAKKVSYAFEVAKKIARALHFRGIHKANFNPIQVRLWAQRCHRVHPATLDFVVNRVKELMA